MLNEYETAQINVFQRARINLQSEDISMGSIYIQYTYPGFDLYFKVKNSYKKKNYSCRITILVLARFAIIKFRHYE